VNFLTKEELLALHDAILALHGGEPGFLNESMLESALAAPQNRHGYEGAGIAECAATYAFHITKAHAFVDGNKRAGAAAALVFLKIHGIEAAPADDELAAMVLDVAQGTMESTAVARFFRKHARR